MFVKTVFTLCITEMCFLFLQELWEALPAFLLLHPSAHSHVCSCTFQRKQPTRHLRGRCARGGLECRCVMKETWKDLNNYVTEEHFLSTTNPMETLFLANCCDFFCLDFEWGPEVFCVQSRWPLVFMCKLRITFLSFLMTSNKNPLQLW